MVANGTKSHQEEEGIEDWIDFLVAKVLNAHIEENARKEKMNKINDLKVSVSFRGHL